MPLLAMPDLYHAAVWWMELISWLRVLWASMTGTAMVERAMGKPGANEGNDGGQPDTALIIRNAMVEVCGRAHEGVQ